MSMTAVQEKKRPLRPKKLIELALRRTPPLYRLASRVYHRMNPSFRTLSPGAPGAIRRAFELVRDRSPDGLVGDYYEFGLFRGFTFLSAQRSCDELGLAGTRFWGFDSFQGLPAVEGIDRAEGEFFEGQFACGKQEVIDNLSRHGMDWSRAELIEGFFSDSLTEELKRRLPFRPAGVVVLDCDLYSSTQEALSWMSGLLGATTVLLFDDWLSFGGTPDRGQPLAFREFLERHPGLHSEEGWDFANNGRTFVVTR
ncbi:MAG TPA: TylF/MycF/NovP-related O-methyltransferase, partial [Thermoanaerobaculia bacterium]|nr:TylF/MycF/NovP-related O-methyltransferase [Thermoanaerobaculia bacterium]